MKTIRFITDKLPYTFGQIVQFKNDIADAFILQGVAVLYTPSAQAPPPQGQTTLNANTPIFGNPPNLNTLGKMAAFMQNLESALAGKMDKAVYDADGNNLVQTTDNLENQPTDFSQTFLAGLTA